jgi:C-terminal processing protease CtpA/Prc
LGKFRLRDITLSFPDSIFVGKIGGVERHGSLGAQVLGRFNVVVDYPGHNLRLKPNKFFKKAFEFNMSGLVVEHSGYHIIREAAFTDRASFNMENENLMPQMVMYQLRYRLERQYKIAEVRHDSPAHLAGLLLGDIILKINGKPVHKYSLDDISSLLSSKEGRKIKILIQRPYGEILKEFNLKRLL